MATNPQTAQGVFEYGDVCASRHKGNSNSVAANPDVQSKVRMQQKILSVLVAGQMCIHDLEVALKISKNTFSGRLKPMYDAGLIGKFGKCSHGAGGAIYGRK